MLQKQFNFILLIVVLLASKFLMAQYIDVPNAHILLEHLVRHSDNLLTEVNLTRANQYTVQNQITEQIRAMRTGWAYGLMSRLLIDPRNPGRIPDYFIGKIVNDFRMQTIMLYDIWWKHRAPSPDLVTQFIITDRAYHNAVAATLFYIEALRRSYLITGAPGRCMDRPVLISRLMKLQALIFELIELMRTIRYTSLFRLPLRPYCFESTFMRYRLQIEASQPLNFIPFPFYHDGHLMGPSGLDFVPPQQNFTPYPLDYWSNMWNQLDQAYLNPQFGIPSRSQPGIPQYEMPMRPPYSGLPPSSYYQNPHPRVAPPSPMRPQQQLPIPQGGNQSQFGEFPANSDARDVVPLDDYDYNR